MKTLIFSTLLFSLQGYALADPLVDAFLPLKHISSYSGDFEKWTHDTALLTLQHCWKYQNANKNLPSELNQGLLGSAVWAQPNYEQMPKLCSSLTQGIQPVCVYSNTWVKNGNKNSGLPNDYLVAFLRQSRFDVEGSLYCYLNAQQVQAQSYTPKKWNITWTTQPKMSNIMTSMGEKNLNMGNVLLSTDAPGLNSSTYTESKIVVFTP